MVSFVPLQCFQGKPRTVNTQEPGPPVQPPSVKLVLNPHFLTENQHLNGTPSAGPVPLRGEHMASLRVVPGALGCQTPNWLTTL